MKHILPPFFDSQSKVGPLLPQSFKSFVSGDDASSEGPLYLGQSVVSANSEMVDASLCTESLSF